MVTDSPIKTPEYRKWLMEIKERIRATQIKAAVQVNSVLLTLYWELGADIVDRQKSAKWGSGFLKQLSTDLMAEFPDMKGFSYRNIRAIRQWFLFYKEGVSNLATTCGQIGQQQVVAALVRVPWGHNRVIISKCNGVVEALYYVKETIENNWSRSVLTHQIEKGLFHRRGKAVTNFVETLPAPQSDLAQQLIKDPYTFDFLTMTRDYNERELETALIDHITKFLLELGAGFAFMGRQRGLRVGKRDFVLDLLFYHTKLHCYVVIELKTEAFEPEYAGKLNFYLKALDEQLRGDGDESTIGILLCKSRDQVVVEYALSDMGKPMGVSEYQLTRALPDNLKPSLPSIEELEAEFGDPSDA